MSQFITNEALHKKTPQEITSLLYEACHNNLSSAITAILEKEYIDANEYLKKANDILHRLGGGLNYEA
ncbi:MAG TPA: flagellar export chaperone FliS, partial [Bacilli bacterium]|nr:flagellar export chaperone FliS [Bacilli bacterium]